MPVIRIATPIRAPVHRVFDLARSLDLHASSMSANGETAVGGTVRGLIGFGEEVTWRAHHLGRWRELTSRITEFERPRRFRDSMVRGDFARFDHDHLFEERDGGTLMIDLFDYTSPHGALGRLADWLLVEGYMRRLLARRCEAIRAVAESGAWKDYVSSGGGPGIRP